MPAFQPLIPHLVKQEVHHGLQRFGHDALMPPVTSNAVADVGFANSVVMLHYGDAADGVALVHDCPLVIICFSVMGDPVVENPLADVDALMAVKMEGTETTVSEVITEKTFTIGEKISIRRFARYEGVNGTVDTYIHMGGKVGVLVQAECPEVNDTVKEVLHDVALQIAAASPVAPEYVTRDQVNPEHLQHETEILAAQARNEGKPEKIIEKMVQGRINKFYEEVCLVEQIFVKDGETRVGKMVETKAPGTKIVAFTRYKMGDGLEKKVSDLAAEVAEQIGKK